MMHVFKGLASVLTTGWLGGAWRAETGMNVRIPQRDAVDIQLIP